MTKTKSTRRAITLSRKPTAADLVRARAKAEADYRTLRVRMHEREQATMGLPPGREFTIEGRTFSRREVIEAYAAVIAGEVVAAALRAERSARRVGRLEAALASAA